MPVSKKDEETKGLYRMVSGILVCANSPFVVNAVNEAAAEIGRSRYTPDAELRRQALADAIRLNLIDRFEYPYELLVRKYGLCESAAQFREERLQFCRRVAEMCGLTG